MRLKICLLGWVMYLAGIALLCAYPHGWVSIVCIPLITIGAVIYLTGCFL